MGACGESSGILLYGAVDGIFRLAGDVTDFETTLLPNVINVEIGSEGPVDAYAWGVLKDRFGFIAPRGLYLTNGSQVDLVSDESLDGFFDTKEVSQGTVEFFDDNTVLFAVQLKTVQSDDAESVIFVFDDRHWVRWTGEPIDQFSGGYLAGTSELRRVEWRENENTDPDLAWAWESNLIHGQETGAGNLTKRFAELLLSAAEGTRITLKTWIDNQKQPTEREIITRDDLYFQRIPIERIGKRLRFRLEGKGPVEIRGIQIEGEVS